MVFLDNGCSDLIGLEFELMFNCIKCGVCFNYCLVYLNVGGYVYGWVYLGLMGLVLILLLNKLEFFRELFDVFIFCGWCEEVCFMGILLLGLLWKFRVWLYRKYYEFGVWRLGLMVYSWLVI